jgi:hypothetical protein
VYVVYTCKMGEKIDKKRKLDDGKITADSN